MGCGSSKAITVGASITTVPAISVTNKVKEATHANQAKETPTVVVAKENKSDNLLSGKDLKIDKNVSGDEPYITETSPNAAVATDAPRIPTPG